MIVDASVAVKWVVAEKDHEAALSVVDFPWEKIAPDLILSEAANVLRKKYKRNEITVDQFAHGLAGIDAAISRFISSRDLVHDAAVLSNELDHSAYDCFYLACALGRGVLVSADKRFVEKCKNNGYGEFVVELEGINSESFEARVAISQVGREAFETIERLSKSIESTFKFLDASARDDSPGRFKIINSEVYGPAFKSPAYIRLVEELEAMTNEKLSVIVALGWLGRRYYHISDFPGLLTHARVMCQNGFAVHRAYFMAQMPSVSTGLAKLKVHWSGQS
jgi:predicted nucleic acid-binding protein